MSLVLVQHFASNLAQAFKLREWTQVHIVTFCTKKKVLSALRVLFEFRFCCVRNTLGFRMTDEKQLRYIVQINKILSANLTAIDLMSYVATLKIASRLFSDAQLCLFVENRRLLLRKIDLRTTSVKSVAVTLYYIVVYLVLVCRSCTGG